MGEDIRNEKVTPMGKPALVNPINKGIDEQEQKGVTVPNKDVYKRQMFVGAWAMALAEIVNTIPIFERRIKLREGLTTMIISMAIGRSLGAILYFFQGLSLIHI